MVNITGAWIYDLRTRLDLTQAEFAKKVGVGQSTVAQWESEQISPRGPARILLEMIFNEAERTAPREKISA